MAIELTTASNQTLSAVQFYTSTPEVLLYLPNARTYLGPGIGINIDSNTTGNIGDTISFLHPSCSTIRNISMYRGSSIGATLAIILGGQLLTGLENAGTMFACYFNNNNFSAATLNAFFTALPATTKVATIDVAGNPGAATCNTAIATDKGYTIVTS